MCPRADQPREAGSWDRAEGWWVVSAEEPRVYEGIWRAKTGRLGGASLGHKSRGAINQMKKVGKKTVLGGVEEGEQF